MIGSDSLNVADMGADWEAIDNGAGSCFLCMCWLSGILVCLDAHLPGPGGRGEELGLPAGWEALTALGTGEGRGEGVGGVGGYWEEGKNLDFPWGRKP